MKEVQNEYEVIYTGANVLTFKGIYFTLGGMEADGKTQRKIYSDKVFMPGRNTITEFELACLQAHPNFSPCFGDQGTQTIVREEAGVGDRGEKIFTNVVRLVKSQDPSKNGALLQWVKGPQGFVATPLNKLSVDEAVQRVTETFSLPALNRLKDFESATLARKSVIGKIDDQIKLLESPAIKQEERKKG